jgi:hypothetical protein
MRRSGFVGAGLAGAVIAVVFVPSIKNVCGSNQTEVTFGHF